MRVTKIGGASVAEALPDIAAALSRHQGPQLVVHGGGPQVSEMADRLGIPTRKIAGRRITDEPTLELVLMVIGGLVHNRVVSALVKAGVAAIGLAGPSVLGARRRPPIEVEGQVVDFGLVGELVKVETGAIRAALAEGIVPVIPSIAGGTGDDQGKLFNINADTAAAELAAALRAEELVQVTDSGGVWGEEAGSLMESLDLQGAKALLASGAASGGMRPKLETAIWALERGLARVRIVGARGVAQPTAGTTVRV